mgnify:CR=1 FL=1
MRNNTQKAKRLINEDLVDLNAKNNYGRTALMYAVVNDNKDIVELLLNNMSTFPTFETNLNAKNNYERNRIFARIYEK